MNRIETVMKTMIILKRFAIVSVLAVCFSSCINEEVEYNPSEAKEITFLVSLSTSGNVPTRAAGSQNGYGIGTLYGGYRNAEEEIAAFERTVEKMINNYIAKTNAGAGSEAAPVTRSIVEGGTEDNRVDEIVILLFSATAPYTYIDRIHVPEAAITDVTGDISRKRFKALIPGGSYTAIVAANSSDYIAAHGSLAGKTLANVEAELSFTHTGKWESEPPSGGYRPFPMSSRPFNLVIPGTVNYEDNPIELMRAMSKVNLKITGNATDAFRTTEIRLCNYQEGAYLVPPAGLSSSSLFDIGAAKPYGGAIIDATGISYSYLTEEIDDNNECIDEIFTFPQAAPASNAGWKDALCLLVNADITVNGTDYSNRWFRLNFTKANPAAENVVQHLNILRNYAYTFTIIDVYSIGYATPQEAYENRSEGLEISLTAFEEDGMNDIIYNGNYQLAVDRSTINIGSAENSTAQLRVYTDYSKGWTISNITYDAGGSGWLSASPTGTATANTTSSTSVTLTAQANTSGTPRTAIVTLTAGNLTHRITVRQEKLHETVNIWLSGSAGNTSRTIQIDSATPWSVVTPPANATLSVTSGNAGTTDLVISRNTTYGSGSFEIRNDAGAALKTINIESYYIAAGESFNIPNDHATGNTVTGDVTVQGGSVEWIIVGQQNSWFTAEITSDGKLSLTANQSSNRERRQSTITLAHAADPTYQITIDVIQDFFIPPFDYLVLKFNWTLKDVDVAVRFVDNEAPFDNTAVGWYELDVAGLVGWGPVEHNGVELLKWGGDARGGEGETVYMNAPLLADDDTLPRYITLEVYAHWFSEEHEPESAGNPTKLSMTAYVGGTMQHVGTNFVNNGGVSVYSSASTRTVRTEGRYNYQRYANGYTGNPDTDGYEKMCTIVYDRVTRAAQITWLAPLSPTQL